jgi:hypothetical protein
MLYAVQLRERSGILHSVFLCAASGSVTAPAAPAGGRIFGYIWGSPLVPPRTKVSYRSLAVIVAGLLAILCGYEVAAESFMTD